MSRIPAAGLLLFVCGVSLPEQQRAATGPLRLLQSNPRYFTDGSGRAIFLTGTHNWNNFEDTGHRAGPGDPPPVLDYKWFLDFVGSHHHSFFRLWRWESPKWTDDEPKGVAYARPHPWLRTGPGVATDEKPKFDLTRFDPEYFARMRQRIQEAGERGIYVSVMLFEGWEVEFLNAWACHPYNAANNINGIDADTDHDGRGLEYYMLPQGAMAKRVLATQEAYVRKVIRFVHEYEATKPKQHPLGMSFQYKGGTNRELFRSPADWVSPNGDPGPYLDNLPTNFSGKVVANDMDHLGGHVCGYNIWVWRRGLTCSSWRN